MALSSGRPLVVTEVAEAGSVTGERLMEWADAIAAGRQAGKPASDQAMALIGALGKPALSARAK